MVTNGAKVIIIGAEDGKQLATQVEARQDAGAIVIAYDRLIENTEAVDYYVAFDNFKVGELQGQALLDGIASAQGPTDPYNIELFSGSPDDANAAVFFNGAMERPAAEDRRRHADRRLRPDRHQADGDRRLEAGERPEPHGHA